MPPTCSSPPARGNLSSSVRGSDFNVARNQWCFCFTTTERLAGQLISSGFELCCWGEGEDSLAWPISPCQNGYNTPSPLCTSIRVYYEALCQGVYYWTVWHNKIKPALMPSKDTATRSKEGLHFFIIPDTTWYGNNVIVDRLSHRFLHVCVGKVKLHPEPSYCIRAHLSNRPPKWARCS